jgi:hypothetical protein
MDRKRVVEALEILNAELAGADDVSEEARAAIRRVTDDVRRLVDQPIATGLEATSTASGVRHSLLEFEAEHPQLTGAINQLAAALANLGI